MAYHLNEITPYLKDVKNATIIDAFYKADSVINRDSYKTILCSISGGSDSDIMIDLISKVDIEHKVRYVWFDTGMEYSATKEQLDYLESRYGIKIRREKAIKPIPTCCREYGQPFLSKYVSEMIARLQRHSFQWEDEPYEVLLLKYPNAKSALKWWCNWHDDDLARVRPNQRGKSSRYSISRNKYLKEFLIQNPPRFKISANCCKYAKKVVSAKVEKEINADLTVIGVRKAEGGIRAGAYKTCYSRSSFGKDSYRPLFWFLDSDKVDYEKCFDIKHSDCYEKWGFKRTGCVGCPFSHNTVTELNTVDIYEPKLYKAAITIFGDSYEYTKQYWEFVREQKDIESGRIRLF